MDTWSIREIIFPSPLVLFPHCNRQAYGFTHRVRFFNAKTASFSPPYPQREDMEDAGRAQNIQNPSRQCQENADSCAFEIVIISDV
jgi:hypothetical protein